jgi:hypothetical protein
MVRKTSKYLGSEIYMKIIDVFWNYLKGYQPHLTNEDWLVDVMVIQKDELINQQIKAQVPQNIERLKCYVFFYENDKSTLIYLLQDEDGKKNISIGLLCNDCLVHSISLIN